MWGELNPDYDLRLIEESEAAALLARLGVAQRRITPQVKADLLRSQMLKEHGGVWVDATLLPSKPLSAWLEGDLMQAGFFAFRSHGDPDLVLQNWFLSAEPGNPLMAAWTDLYTDYFRSARFYPSWKRALAGQKPMEYLRYSQARRRGDMRWFVEPDRGRDCPYYPYAVHNYNLAYLLRTNSEVRAIWDRVPKKWSALPLMIGGLARDEATPLPAFLSAASELLGHAPVHKLNNRDVRFDELVSCARTTAGLPPD